MDTTGSESWILDSKPVLADHVAGDVDPPRVRWRLEPTIIGDMDRRCRKKKKKGKWVEKEKPPGGARGRAAGAP